MPGPLLLAIMVVSAAPVPADTEKPKPRPKLIATASLTVRVEEVVWLPDGKHLILRCSDGMARLIRRDQFGDDEPVVKPVVEFKLPARCQHLALTPDGTELYAVVSANGRLTVESRAYFWSVKTVLEGKDLAKANRMAALNTDGSASGKIEVTADGRQFVVPLIESRSSGWYAARFDRLSAKTGDWASEWAKIDDPDSSYSGHAYDSKTGRLFVQFQGADDTTVRCLDAAADKPVWEQKLPDRPYRGSFSSLVPSSDSRLIALVQPLLVMRPVNQQPGRPPQFQQMAVFIPVLLNAKTGEPIELPTEDVYQTSLYGFSSDGRLLAGRVTNASGITQTVVWDTKLKVVAKAWRGYYSDGLVRFAPTGHDLLAVEREQTTETVYTDIATPNSSMRTAPFTRTTYKSVMGVWDLAPLVK